MEKRNIFQLNIYNLINLILLLLDHGLPLALALSNGEAVDLRLNLRPPFSHVVFNVKHERVLAEVRVHHLPWSLKAHGRVQVRLQRRERGVRVMEERCCNAICTIHQKQEETMKGKQENRKSQEVSFCLQLRLKM